MSQEEVSQPAISEGYAQLESVRLHYAECGAADGELVLLLHGFPEFWYSWRHQLPVLGSRFHAVAPDLRGYNLSDKPQCVEDYAVDVLAGDIVGLIDYFGVKKAAIVGHDWGGSIAWAVARKYPDRLSKLAVMQVPPAAVWRANFSLRQLLHSWYMILFQLPKVPEWAISRNNFEGIDQTFRQRVINKEAFNDRDVELYKEAIRRPGALTAAVNYYRANVGRLIWRRDDNDAQGSERGVSVPTLFIFAEQDFAIIPETARGVEKYVSGPYRELLIPDSGHWVQNEAVEKVNEALMSFLTSD